jgi:hypothetical protein
VQELYGAIAGLSEDFRLAIVAVDVLGLSYREAARALGTREATITTRLFRARKQVVEQISDQPAATKAEHTPQPPDSVIRSRPAKQSPMLLREDQPSSGVLFSTEEQ